MLDTISISLNFLKLDLWPQMWSVLKSVPRAVEKLSFLLFSLFCSFCVKPLSGGMSYEDQLIISGLFCHLKLVFTFFIFCLGDPSVGVSRLLKSLASTGLLSIYPFMVVSISLVYWSASMLGACMLIIVTKNILRLFTWSLHNVLPYLL